ncbi:MAG TPA: oxygenase MpaB family protein [Nocardioides sp.]|nr:oxygenase MpaB family protein [Nocardioides sp.]
MLPRTHWLRYQASLDPETDYEEIYRVTVTHEFPWDMNQALSFALFRTYAVPSIGRLLHDTGEFTARTQKRYDDTALLLDAASVDGLHSERGRRAIRRINQMHRAYDISDADMRYVLSTFVVVPKRWLDEYGWRPLTPAEVRASTRYYQELGRLLGIRDVPATYDEFAALLDDHEAEHFGFDPGGRRVADATLALMTTFYPRPLRRPVALFARALMDEPLREAFGYAAPPRAVVRAARGGLRARGRAERLLPARRRPLRVEDLRWIRSYPDGYEVELLGTFPGGCPVSPAVSPEVSPEVSPATPAPR